MTINPSDREQHEATDAEVRADIERQPSQPAGPSLWFTQNIDAEDGVMITVERAMGSPLVHLTTTSPDSPPASVRLRPPALAGLVAALVAADPGIVHLTTTSPDSPPASVRLRPPALAGLVAALVAADPGIGTRRL
jgi:hypothetical protein